MDAAGGGGSSVLPSLVEAVERFARRHLDAAATDRAGRLPDGLVPRLAELGLLGLSLPEAYGGAGFGLAEVAAIVARLARHDRSVATTVGLHLGLGTRGLVAFGSPSLQERYLPRLAAGELVAAFATTEAEAGSDLTAIRTRAEALGDGRLRLDGSKIYVTNGGLAGLFTITAATPGIGGRRGHSLLLVERGDQGLQVLGEEHKLGLRGSSTTALALDGLELPGERLLGEPGRGMEHLAHILAWGRTVMAAGCIGTAERALALAAAHVATRRQFGRTLCSFEVVRDQLADLAAMVHAMGGLVAATAAAPPALLESRSAAAKVFCSERAWEVCDVAVQLHGGAGFIEDTGLPLLLRDARIPRIFEGANDVLAVHLGSREATAPAPRPTVAASADPRLVEAAQGADRLAERIAAFRQELVSRHGLRLLRRQRLLHRLGRLAVLREAADAAVAGATIAEAAFAQLAVASCARRAAGWLDERPDNPAVDAVVDSLCPPVLP